VRTTLTLDEDVAEKLKAEARRAGKPVKQVVNEALRRGLALRRETRSIKPFRVRVKDMGVYPGANYDNIGVLLEQVEGPRHR
jgi:Ribbon-helix-helix protein, copG family